jgi:hypothetical protein
VAHTSAEFSLTPGNPSLRAPPVRRCHFSAFAQSSTSVIIPYTGSDAGSALVVLLPIVGVMRPDGLACCGSHLLGKGATARLRSNIRASASIISGPMIEIHDDEPNILCTASYAMTPRSEKQMSKDTQGNKCRLIWKINTRFQSSEIRT